MEDIKKQLRTAILGLFGVEVEPDVTSAPEETGADYATNVALKLAKEVHKAPMMIAEEIKGALENVVKNTEIEVAKPGFLNFRLRDEAIFGAAKQYAGSLDEMFQEEKYQGKMVVTEFSDPNPFKVLHVGHLYTSVVGDSISRILELAGAKVVRANFGGDVGLHVGKTIYSLRRQLASFAEARSRRLPLQGRAALPHESQGDSFSSGVASKEKALLSLYSDSYEVRCNSGSSTQEPIVVSDNGFFASLTIDDIAKCYVEGTRAYDEDEAARTEITKLNKVIYALAELGEEKSRERLEIEKIAEDYDLATTEVAETAELYWWGRRLSYDYFKDFYAQIGVKFDKFYPESSVADKGVEEVRAHVGDVYEESEGAIVYRGEKVGLHTRVFINCEGVPTYETKDVGLIFTKWEDWHFDESIVITGDEQTDYMKVVLASVKEYAPELVERTRHLTHGMVKLPGNEKMSSRKGNFLKAVDVIKMIDQELAKSLSERIQSYDEPRRSLNKEKARLSLSRRRPRRTNRLAIREEERRDPATAGVANAPLRKTAQATPGISLITLAAVKYAFLRYRMGGDIIFDPKESVSTTGNSGVYLLYATVRARKVLERVENSNDRPVANLSNKIVQSGEKAKKEREFERRLNKKIVQYGEVIRGAVAEKAPYKICTYLYELAQEFSRFYENVKVVGSEQEEEKAEIVRAYLNVIEHGLGLLGIEVPEEM